MAVASWSPSCFADLAVVLGVGSIVMIAARRGQTASHLHGRSSTLVTAAIASPYLIWIGPIKVQAPRGDGLVHRAGKHRRRTGDAPRFSVDSSRPFFAPLGQGRWSTSVAG